MEDLSRGDKMKVTKEMFILIGKCDQEYFKENAARVLLNEISLKCLVQSVKKVLLTNKTKKLVTTLTNYQTTEQLEKKFPGKSSEEKIKMFVGAELENKKTNRKGMMLERYCKSVLENKKSEPVKIKVVEKLSDIKPEVLVEADIIVLNLKKFDMGVPVDAIDVAMKSVKPSSSVLLLFDNEQGHFEALKYLSSLSLSVGFVLKQIYFEVDKPKVDHGFLDNAVYGILLGRVFTVGPPVKVINGPVEKCLANFVSMISPMPAKVIFVNEGSLPIVAVHRADLEDCEVTYFGTRDSIEKFLKTKEICSSSSVTKVSPVTESEPEPCCSKSLPRMNKKPLLNFNQTIESIQDDLDESFGSSQMNSSSMLEEKTPSTIVDESRSEESENLLTGKGNEDDDEETQANEEERTSIVDESEYLLTEGFADHDEETQADERGETSVIVDGNKREDSVDGNKREDSENLLAGGGFDGNDKETKANDDVVSMVRSDEDYSDDERDTSGDEVNLYD